MYIFLPGRALSADVLTSEHAAWPHLHNLQVANIELRDGLGPNADPDLCSGRCILSNQHLSQVLVHLQNQHRLFSTSRWSPHASCAPQTVHGEPAGLPNLMSQVMGGGHCASGQLWVSQSPSGS